MTEVWKLYRKDGIETSKEAAESLSPVTHLESFVYDIICDFPEGCTQDEVLQRAKHHGDFAYSSITARFRGLIDKKKIVRTDERRKGRSGRNQSVLLADIYATDQPSLI